MDYERDGDTNCRWCSGNDTPTPGKETERTGLYRKNRHHSDHSTDIISLNSQKRLRKLKRFTDIQTFEKKSQLKLVWKI